MATARFAPELRSATEARQFVEDELGHRRITRIYVVANPQKVARLDRVTALTPS